MKLKTNKKNEEKVKTKRLRTVERKVKQKQTIKKQNNKKDFSFCFVKKTVVRMDSLTYARIAIDSFEDLFARIRC
jgi:hypothetical protein